MAFDLDDDELEATRVHINHLQPKKEPKKEEEKDVKKNDKQ